VFDAVTFTITDSIEKMDGSDSGAADAGNPEVRYRHLIENIQDAVVEFDFVDGEPVVRNVNDAFEETFGYALEEIRGESLNARIIPDGEEAEAREIDKRTEDGETTSQQLTRETATGTREFLHRSVPYDDASPVDGIAVYTDITERKRAEQKRKLLTETSRNIGEAETLEEGFETTLESICAYTEWAYGEVWRPDPESEQLTFAVGYTDDPECERFLHASQDVRFAPGEGLPGRVFSAESSEWLPDVTKVSADVFHRTDLAAEAGLRAAFGAPVVADGDVVAVLAFSMHEGRDPEETLVTDVTDITRSLGELVARKQAEEVVRRRNEQLEEFANVISHDLRNPLNVAMSRLELAMAECHNPHLEDVADAHDRMGELIDDILTLARQGRSLDDTETVRIEECATQSWAMTSSEYASLCVETDIVVQGDRSRLQQLFENLFRNALDHGPDDVTVTVGGTDSGFYVADDGPGIPESEREDVFDLGYSTRADGTGLGLPIVEEIAEAHGWSVTVTDSETGGTRFEFTGVDRC
jgi:PAS domain S-box-containing protein